MAVPSAVDDQFSPRADLLWLTWALIEPVCPPNELEKVPDDGWRVLEAVLEKPSTELILAELLMLDDVDIESVDF